MNECKVSIIVPVYNVEQYLGKCLDSLTDQTLKEIEIIVVNDGTKDHSQEIIDRYAAKDPRIVPLMKENGGLSDARNFGLARARGRYIGFVDADDYVESSMFGQLYETAEESGADMVECDLFHDYVGSMDEEHGEPITDPKMMLMEGRSVVWNKIYRHDWLSGTGVRFLKGLMYEDVAYYSMLVPYISRIAYVPTALIHYVQRGSSLNYNATLRTMDILKIIESILGFYKEHGFYDSYYHELEYLSARLILCSSFLRMARIPDKKEREYALRSSWESLNEWFPDWHDNAHLKSLHTRNTSFMKAMNPLTFRMASAVMPAVLSLRHKPIS